MSNEEAKEEKKWFKTLLSYAHGSGGRLTASVIFSMISLTAGIVPYYCVYAILDKYITGGLDKGFVLRYCAVAVCAYLVKVICFGISTGISHYVAFNVLEGLRLKVSDVFLSAPLGEVNAHSIGEIMVGDGINDSPALSAADAGIAVSDGAEIARQIADITISSDNLESIVVLKELSTLLMKRIRFNYRTIVGVNTALIGLGIGGVISPSSSAMLHNLSTLALGLMSMTDLIGNNT